MFPPIILFKVDLLNFSIYCNIMQNPPKKLLDQVRDIIRLKHYSYRTEETYVQWIVRYILFHNKRHPKDMGVPEIEEFLTHLAVEGNVAAATQNQALNAILFLYRQVLQIELADRINAIRAKRPQQIPIVLSPDEAFAIIQQTTGVHRLIPSARVATPIPASPWAFPSPQAPV
jgi:site-specific recombinase XerD